MADDPYAFPPGTPGLEGGPPHPGIRMSVANAFSVPPGTPQPPRMPERQMSMPGKCSFRYSKTCLKGTQWLSGRVLDWRPRGCGFEPHPRHCVVSLSKTHLSLLSTGSTQEDPSQHN